MNMPVNPMLWSFALDKTLITISANLYAYANESPTGISFEQTLIAIFGELQAKINELQTKTATDGLHEEELDELLVSFKRAEPLVASFTEMLVKTVDEFYFACSKQKATLIYEQLKASIEPLKELLFVLKESRANKDEISKYFDYDILFEFCFNVLRFVLLMESSALDESLDEDSEEVGQFLKEYVDEILNDPEEEWISSSNILDLIK